MQMTNPSSNEGSTLYSVADRKHFIFYFGNWIVSHGLVAQR